MCTIAFSVAVLAEIPLRSPKKFVIFIIKKKNCWVKVSKNKITLFWKQLHWLPFQHRDIIPFACCCSGSCVETLMKNVNVELFRGHAVKKSTQDFGRFCHSQGWCIPIWRLPRDVSAFIRLPIYGTTQLRHTISDAWSNSSVTSTVLVSTLCLHRLELCDWISCLQT